MPADFRLSQLRFSIGRGELCLVVLRPLTQVFVRIKGGGEKSLTLGELFYMLGTHNIVGTRK